MYFTRQRIQRQTPSESSATSENTGLFRKRRPFTNQDDRGVMTPQEQETPDLQTQLNRAARFSQHMSRVKVYGNRPVIQPKIAVGAPGDRYELEADQMADRVMSMAPPGKNQSIQREALPEEEKDPLQTKSLAASITPVVQRETLATEEEQKEEDATLIAQAKTLGSSTSYLQRETQPAATEEEQKEEDATLIAQAKALGSSTSYLQREPQPAATEEEQKEEDPSLIAQAKTLGSSTSYLQREAQPAATEEEQQEEDPTLAQAKTLGSSTSYLQREAQPAATEEEQQEEDPTLAQAKALGSSSSYLQREAQPAVTEEEQQEEDPTLAQAKALGSRSSYLQREPQSAVTEEEQQEEDPTLAQAKALGSSSSYLQREAQPAATEEEQQEEDPTLAQAKALGSSSSYLQREAQPAVTEEEQQEEDPTPAQRKPSPHKAAKDQSFDAGSNVESQLNNSKGGGSPLPDEVRSFMEARFGADLNQVRVHTGSEAVEMNKELNAQAFTHGKDIYFGSGRYNPGSSEGKHLLAHELTHVIQQTGSVQPKLDIGNVGTEYKQEAKQVIHGNTSESLGSSQKVVQQKCADCQEEDEKLMRKENPTAEKKKQNININPPSDTDTQLLAGVIFAEADAVAKTNEEREAIASVFLNSVSHVEDLRNGKICKHLKPEQRKFIYNRDKQDFGEKVFDAIKQRSVAFGGGRWKLAMNDNKMHSKEQLDKLLPSEKKALVQAIEAAKAVKSGQNRDTEVIGFNQGGSLGSRMATVKTIGKHTFYKFKKGLECGEWKENK